MTKKRVMSGVVVILVGSVLGYLAWKNFFFTALPHEMPDDFTLTWESGGGMSPSSEEVILHGKNGTASAWNAEFGTPEHSTTSFTLSDAEASELYLYLRTHRADVISTSEHAVYDAENDGYDLSWGDHAVQISGAEVDKRDLARFAEIYTYLSHIFGPHVPVFKTE